jgi:tripartite-type tricarboxylate transporter receptor subunit TctC
MTRMVRCFVLAAPLIAAFVALPAWADPVEDFYRGKQIRIVIRAAPGGNYDLYSRLLARHIVRFIPGHPTAIPVNMPGGSGLTTLNYVADVHPRDGTVLTMVTQTFPLEQALALNDKLKVDLRALNWIGNMSDENLFLLTRRSSTTRTLDDAKQRETTLAATGAGGSEVILVSILNQFLGTRFKNIIGYRNSPEMNLAMERGETEGRITTNLRALFASRANGAAGFNLILQTGMQVDKDQPNVPLLRNLARSPNDKLAFDFISRTMALARPVATNDNVPLERVEALRRAFDATMKDADFLAEARQQDLDISPWTGEELQKTVVEIVNAQGAVLEQIRKAIQSGSVSGERKEPAR